MVTSSTRQIPETETGRLAQRSVRPAVSRLLAATALLPLVVFLGPGLATAATAPTASADSARPSEARQLVIRVRALREQYVKDDTLRENLSQAEELCRRAIQLDPAEAEAWALSSWACSSMIAQGYDRSPARYEAARRQAERAVQLAPDSNEARYALAFSDFFRNLPEAERRMRELVGRAPGEKLFLRMLGNVLRGEGRNAEALECFDRAAAQPGGDSRALMLRVPILMELGRGAEAEASIDRSFALQPSRKTQFMKINFLRRRGDLAAAQAELAKLPPELLREEQGACVAALLWWWKRDPEKMLAVLGNVSGDFFNNEFYQGPKAYLTGWAHQNAGRRLAAQADWRTALELLTQRLADQSVPVGMMALKAELLSRLDDNDGAAVTLRLHQRMKDRNESEVADDVAVPFILLGKQDAVLGFFAAQLKSGEDPFLRSNLRLNPAFDSLRGQTRFAALLDEPAKTAPGAPAAPTPFAEARQLVAKARALDQQFVSDDTLRENLVEAEALCKRAVELDPNCVEAWVLASKISASFVTMGYNRSTATFEAARSQAERAVQLAPDSNEAMYVLAGSFRLQRSTLPEAERRMRELVKRAPDDQRFLRLTGIVLRREGRNREALEFLDRAAALPGGDPKALMLRVPILMELGRFAEAEESVDRSQALLPSRKTRLMKINFLRLRGDLERARTELAKLPPAILLEEQGACVAAWVELWSREPEKMLAVLKAAPEGYYQNDFYEGPKVFLEGLAHQLAGRDADAKEAWRLALEGVNQRFAADQSTSIDLLNFKAELLARLGAKNQAAQVLHLYQLAKGRGDSEVAGDVAGILLLLGQQDAVLDFLAAQLQGEVGSILRTVFRLSPAYDALRGHPRFEALLSAPAGEE